MFERETNLRFECVRSLEWTPAPNSTLEDRRRGLLGMDTDENWILLGFVPAPDGATEPDLVVPFDPRALVFDYPEKSEAENSAILAHALGHIFAAGHSADANSFMHLPPGSQMDGLTRSAILLTRQFDTRMGTNSLNGDSLAQLTRVWSQNKYDHSPNPIYQEHFAAGCERLSLGMVQRAVTSFARAIDIVPADQASHYALAASYLIEHEYGSAAGEFRLLAALSPQSAEPLNNLAAIFLEARRDEPAGIILRRVTAHHPEYAPVLASLGKALAATKGYLDDGIEELRIASSLNPGDVTAKTALDRAMAAKSEGHGFAPLIAQAAPASISQ
jgi:tetratricopeptide (TPR) repeat protein